MLMINKLVQRELKIAKKAFSGLHGTGVHVIVKERLFALKFLAVGASYL